MMLQLWYMGNTHVINPGPLTSMEQGKTNSKRTRSQHIMNITIIREHKHRGKHDTGGIYMKNGKTKTHHILTPASRKAV
jgi:hypothetical protein